MVNCLLKLLVRLPLRRDLRLAETGLESCSESTRGQETEWTEANEWTGTWSGREMDNEEAYRAATTSRGSFRPATSPPTTPRRTTDDQVEDGRTCEAA